MHQKKRPHLSDMTLNDMFDLNRVKFSTVSINILCESKSADYLEDKNVNVTFRNKLCIAREGVDG